MEVVRLNGGGEVKCRRQAIASAWLEKPPFCTSGRVPNLTHLPCQEDFSHSTPRLRDTSPSTNELSTTRKETTRVDRVSTKVLCLSDALGMHPCVVPVFYGADAGTTKDGFVVPRGGQLILCFFRLRLAGHSILSVDAKNAARVVHP